MPIIRRKLESSEVYPDDIRYDDETDTVQSFVNGEWVDNPDIDPRGQTTFPARLTSDSRCDAAQSVTDAFKTQIDSVLSAIDGAQSAFTIAGIILSLFTFGVFGVFISLALFLAHVMLDAGTASIGAALTSGTYDTFMCVLFSHMTAGGRIESGALSAVEDDVTAQIGGLAATILNAMLSLAGEGGVNNLASLGEATGDCSGCVNDECNVDNWVVGSLASDYMPGILAGSGCGAEISRTSDTITVSGAVDTIIYGMYRVDLASVVSVGCTVDMTLDSGSTNYDRSYSPGEDDAGVYFAAFSQSCVDRIIILSNVPFTCTFTFGSGVC